MFHSSSLPNRHNADGSTNVKCYQCGQFIDKTFVRMDRALCAICQKAQDGELLTQEAVELYERSKQGKGAVSLVVVPQEVEPGGFSLRAMVGDAFKAVGFRKKEKDKAVQSVQVAKSKQRKRMFESVDLGAMEDIDAQLKPK